MKCSRCGYVSFDDLRTCKNCGLSFDESAQEEERSVTKLQAELFSVNLDDEITFEDLGKQENDSSGERIPPGTIQPEDTKKREEERMPDEKIEHQQAEEVSLPTLELDIDPSEEEAEIEREEPIEPPAVEEEAFPEDRWVEEGAGFALRLMAFATDSLILTAVLSVFLGGALLALGGEGYGWSYVTTPKGINALLVPFYLLGLFLSLGYFTFFVGWAGRTPGKVLLKLEIRRTDGGPMTYARAFLRWVGYLVSITFAGLGFLWIFFDERKRGWHDYLSGTWVKNLRNDT